MDVRRYFENSYYLSSNKSRILLLSLVISVSLVLYINSRETGTTKPHSWHYHYRNVQGYNYFNPYLYIDNYQRLNTGISIYRKILNNSQLGYFTALRLSNAIVTECVRYNIDPDLVFAVIMVESSFRPKAVSTKGAAGLMQVLPSTAEYISERFGYGYKDENTLYKPAPNVRIGIAYLHYLYQKYGRLQNALWAYNYGPTKYDTISKRNPSFIPQYVREVMKNWRNFHVE